MKNYQFYILLCIILFFCGGATGTNLNPRLEPMVWAKTLQEDNVVMIEAFRQGKYCNYAKEDWPEIIQLINSTPPWPLAKRVTLLAGPSPTYYITTSDGLRHSYSFNVNHVLQIDDVSYKADYQWMVDTFQNIEGDAPVPEDFWERSTVDLYYS